MTSIKLQRTNIRGVNNETLQTLIEQNKGVYTQFYDPAYVESLEENLLAFINPVYFRSKFIGFEDYPTPNNPEKPLIFISNHSGMAFPWDAMVFGGELYHRTKKGGHNSIRALTAPMLSETYLMNPYMIPFLWKRVGGIDATSLNFETLMFFNDADVLIYPEGVPGIGKGFNRRYQLQRFSTSFIRMSLKHKTDVIPVATVNAEYINPYSYRWNGLNRLMQKIGIPYLPIGALTLLVIVQPWAFYFGLPARLTYVKGDRIKPYEMTDKDFDDLTIEEIRAISEQVKAQMQAHLTESVKKYGQTPYNWKDLLKTQWKNRSRFWFHCPPFWPFLFWEHERQYLRFKKDGTPIHLDFGFGGFLKMLVRHAFLLFYFLPILGWIPLFIKGYSKKGWKD